MSREFDIAFVPQTGVCLRFWLDKFALIFEADYVYFDVAGNYFVVACQNIYWSESFGRLELWQAAAHLRKQEFEVDSTKLDMLLKKERAAMQREALRPEPKECDRCERHTRSSTGLCRRCRLTENNECTLQRPGFRVDDAGNLQYDDDPKDD